MERPLTISQVSRSFDLSPKTLRFYERVGLLPPTRRNESGYRVFDETHLEQLALIIKVKKLGLPLRAVKESQALIDGGHCQDLRAHLRNIIELRIRETERQTEELQALRKRLRAGLEHLEQILDDKGDIREPAPCMGCQCFPELGGTAATKTGKEVMKDGGQR
ncbi:MAG: MerR family transcriptional regulator [Chloroflexi bacterium]|nr:MerR family transcriptional regulator [Chloroflexota bacterium]